MKQNLHTHTLFCDGKNTPEEMAESAISHGFSSLGFSSHVHTGFPFDVCGIVSSEKTDEYFAELERLKRKYDGQLKIFSGLELESRDSMSMTPSIGGWRPLIESYYEEVKRFASFSPYQITGHIDLVTKFCEKNGWKFEDESWYRDAALAAAEECIRHGKIVEVNTGAISRGYRTTPYPAPFILKYLREKNAPITLSSDCHAKENIEVAFDETLEMLRKIGFRELYVLTGDGFRAEGISG